MFVIDSDTNSIKALTRRTFTELGFKERAHLQEWIAGNPECLGERLLIIQKEFSDFSETNERLDLLALDKDGNLVIIENKLDDSGRDVTWQALKYASYCSTLTKEEIRTIFQKYLDSHSTGKKAEEELSEFFDEVEYSELVINQRMTQRIILVAAHFRKEVTSTVLWLMNYKIQLQCFKATPYELDGQFFLTLEQIIPTKDAQDYVISMTNKAQEEIKTEEELKARHKNRIEYWSRLLRDIKSKSTMFQNSNPVKENWIAAGGTSIQGLSYQLQITLNNASVLLNLDRKDFKENKSLFDMLFAQKDEIERKFGQPLKWERMDSAKSSKIMYSIDDVNYANKEDFDKIVKFHIDYVNKLEAATKEYMPVLKKSLTNPDIDTTE